MTALELIARLREQGIRISAHDGALELDAPKGALNDELRAEVVAHKPELLRLLSWSRRSSSATAVALQPVARDESLSLSWAQQRLWFLDQLEPGNAAYNISWTVRLRGDLQREMLHAALTDLIERHETLRTVFPSAEGSPRVVIQPDATVALEFEDLSGSGDEALRARLSELAGHRFDLGCGPLLRPHLLKLSHAEHILLIVVHHIVADGASMRILFRELAELYEARLDNRAATLPELPVQYVDYAAWQRSWLDSGEIDRQSHYWLQQLQGLPPLLELPTDRPRAAAMRYRGASVLRVLPADLAADLRRVSREQGCTLFMIMLAAFFVLLMRYAGRDDLAVGTPLGGRGRTSLEGLIGFFINTVVLRADLSGDPTFSNLLQRVRDISLEAHANQDLPFEKLVELIQPQRELSYAPIFQVMFDLQEEPRWKLPVRSLEVVPEVVFSSRTASFDLTLSVRQAEQGLDAMFEYDTDLFDEASIEAMAQRYQTLLEAVVLDADQPISRLPLIEPGVHVRQIHDWNTASQPYPDTLTIAELFEAQVTATPDAIALIDGARSYGYAELNAAANRIAIELRAEKIGPDDPVALCAYRSGEAFAAILGILKAGGCVVPLDPGYPPERLTFMLEDSGATLLLQPSQKAQLAEQLSSGSARVRTHAIQLTAQLDGSDRVSNPPPAAGSRNLAYLMYTSGTSGVPKGAELEHGGFVNYVTQLAAYTGIERSDRVLQFASLSFDIAIEESLAALLNGATLVLRDAEMSHSLADFVSGCERHSISWLSLPTAWWHELCEALARGDVEMPSQLRSVVIGGEKAELQALRKWQQSAAGVRIFNTYGPTETSIVAAWMEITHLDATACTELPIGLPVPNVRVWVTDEHLQPVPEGLPGEICIAGPGLARGYRNQPALTAERFVQVTLPDGSHETLYRTGDRARYVQEQGLIFLGRNDAQLKLRGHRIEPGEIEAVLSSLPGIGRCAVIMHGEAAAARLVAYVTGTAEPNDVREQLASRLPDFMVPAAIVALPSLPFTANGKLDRSALPEPAADQLQAVPHALPTSPVEQKLAEIWADVLGVRQPGVHDDFFALGGHSLIATRVMARVRDAFDATVPLRALFDNPTVARLAKVIDQNSTDSGSPLLRRPATTVLPPLSWPQQRLLMLDNLEPGNTAYNLYSAAELAGPLDINALQYAVDCVVQRHEVLRTCFAEHAGEPVQVVQPEVVVSIKQHKLSGADPQAKLQALIDVPFDLGSGPLFQVHVLRAGTDKQGRARHYLLLLLHHIVADGWSVQVLLRELQLHYRAHTGADSAQLSELPVQYADFACWQREELRSGKLQQAENYWQQKLDDMHPVFGPLPDYPRPAVQSYRGAWVNRTVDGALLQRLQRLATQQSASLFMVLLTGFKATLLRHTGCRDLVVGTPVAGRTHTNLEPLIGCFLNTLVLRTRCANNPDFITLLEQVRDTTLSAYEHQSVPFERVLELLQPPRSPAHTPLVQVLFNFHNERNEMPGLPGIEVRPLLLNRAAAKFDLSVSVVENESGLTVGFEYGSDLYAPNSMDTLIDDYLIMLGAMVDEPDQAVCDVPLSAVLEAVVDTGKEAARAADLPSDTVGSLISGPSISDAFRAAAARYPDNIALVCGDQTLSYRELARQVNTVAAAVRNAVQQSVPTGQQRSVGQSMAAVCLGHDERMPAVLLGVLQAGCAYVPLDKAAPVPRCRQILASANIDVIVTDKTHEVRAHEIAGDRYTVLVIPEIDTDTGGNIDLSPMAISGATSGDSLAYVLFTSGSTGEPKGVMQTHANVLHHIATYSRAINLSASDALSLIPAYGFDAAVMDIYGALLNGACLHLLDITETPDAAAVEAVLQTVSVLHSTPTVLRYLLGERDAPAAPVQARVLVLGGEEARYSDFELFNKHFLPGATFVNGLGPSESTLALQFKARHGEQLPGRQVPVGLPVSGCDVLLVDEHGNRAGVEGEIVICSEHISPGYLNQPELTAQKMRRADAMGRTHYYTGDRARRMPDGQLVYTGRQDNQLKIRGHRIEPGDIESALGRLEGVSRCAVAPAGETLHAYYSGLAQPHALRQALQALLPGYMVPSRFLRLSQLPLKSNGKVDRAALVTAAASEQAVHQSLHVAPVTAVEQELAAMWSELLGVEHPGVHDDFFALGGHSLLAMRLLARIQDRYNQRLSLRDFFTAASIGQLAEYLDDQAVAMPESEPLQPRPSANSLPPLSWAQQRLWFLDRLEPENAAYNLHWAARLNGMPDLESLQAALRDLQARHESLRTSFGDHAGAPLQVIHKHAPIELQHEVMAGANDTSLRSRLLELIRRPFKLQKAPLLRAYVLELSADESVLLLVMHHIVTDGWSMGVLFRELSACYEARLHDRQAPLAPLPVQYADFALWQQRSLSGRRLESHQAYWAKKLAGLPALLELPLDRPRPPVQRFRGAWVNRRFDAQLLQRIRQLAAAESATVFMVLLAVFKVLLMRHTGRTDVAVGAPVAGRSRSEVENLIGFFLNTLVLRTELDPDAAFRDVLAAVRQTTLEAYDHQELPFEKLLELLQPERSSAHSPLVQVTINLHNEPGGQLQLSGLQAEVMNIDRGTSKFDIALAMVESDSGLNAGIEYNTDLFDANTVSMLLEHFGELLEAFTREPALPVSHAVLSSDRRAVQPDRYANYAPPGVPPLSLVDGFAHAVARHGERPAVRTEHASLTYRELDGLANTVAKRLTATLADNEAGVATTGQHVGILLGHEARAIVALLGVLKAGHVYVPLDRHSPPDRLRTVIASAGISAVISDAEHAALLPEDIRSRLPLILLTDDDAITDAVPPTSVAPDQLAYILYTSGSTGEPKGVMQTHANVMHHVRTYSHSIQLAADDRLTLLAAFGFDAAVMDIFGALLNGACLHPMELRSEEYPGQLLDRMSTEGITVLHATPTVFRYLMRSKVCRHELDAVRAVVLGGEEAHGSDFDLFRRQFSPPAIFVNGLGPSESTTAAQFFADHNTRLPGGLVPVGQAVADTELLVLDESGEPTGLSGELAIKSAYVATGYWQLPELTSERFLTADDGQRLYLTGDRVRRLPDGQLVFLGRVDSQVKLRGVRIEPAEIEAVLTSAPGVSGAAVVLNEDSQSGAARLAGYYVGDADTADLRQALRRSLPEFMVPAALVRVERIPLTVNGKLDKQRLPPPDWERDVGHEFVAPRNSTEAQLSAIWADVLGIRKISVHDDFFELGGHSLLAAQLAARMNESMRVVVPLRRLFDAPTVAQIAEHIDTLQWAMQTSD